jgi:hypothetical protein
MRGDQRVSCNRMAAVEGNIATPRCEHTEHRRRKIDVGVQKYRHGARAAGNGQADHCCNPIDPAAKLGIGQRNGRILYREPGTEAAHNRFETINDGASESGSRKQLERVIDRAAVIDLATGFVDLIITRGHAHEFLVGEGPRCNL